MREPISTSLLSWLRTRHCQVSMVIGLVLTVALLAAVNGRAFAAASEWLEHGEAQVRLIAAADPEGNPERLYLGLQFQLKPDWKVYWRARDGFGYPPAIDWAASENMRSAEFRWPVPKRFSLFGLDSFGYADEVIYPIVAHVERPGEAVSVRAALDYLICSNICIPKKGEFRLDLPAGPLGPSAQDTLIEQALARVPGDGSAVGLSLERAGLTGDTENPLLEVVVRSTMPVASPDLFVEGPPEFTFARPEVELRGEGKSAVLRVQTQRSPSAETVLEGKMLTLTVADGNRGLEAETVARFLDGVGTTVPARAGALLAMLGFALLGGLILNLMPCVLPVLSMKLLSVVKQGGRDRAEVRLSFLASAAGILFSFLVLAGGAIGLKAVGMAAGWGIQFQQPLFLTAMALVLTFFALNLFGVFEVPLPDHLAALGQRGDGHHLGAHFVTGAFATLLATPCSAPFLGTAVGFALARGPVEILLIFVALGLGLALPYLLVAATPGLAARLPRPGPWMVWLRRILGLALVGTAVWLLTVLSAQIGLNGALLAATILAALALTMALARGPHKPLRWAMVPVLAIAAIFGPTALVAPEVRTPDASLSERWEPFDEGRIAEFVAQGRVVFVDVTAEWCITCQVNKKLVIDAGTVTERFDKDSVVLMRADWTLPSDTISEYLSRHGRYGIPFNAVYGPGVGEPVLLPELLTVQAVLEALDRAAGSG